MWWCQIKCEIDIYLQDINQWISSVKNMSDLKMKCQYKFWQLLWKKNNDMNGWFIKLWRKDNAPDEMNHDVLLKVLLR